MCIQVRPDGDFRFHDLVDHLGDCPAHRLSVALNPPQNNVVIHKAFPSRNKRNAPFVYQLDGDGEIVWYASGTFLTDYYDTLVSGGNHAYAIAAFDAMNEKEGTTALPSVSLEEPKLIVTDQTAMIFASFLCGVIPFSVLLGGFVFVRKRRRA